MNATLKSLGYDITYTHGITAETTSFLPDVLKMKSEGVQMLYESELPTQQAATLAKELQQENLKVINVEIAAYAANLPQLAGSAGQGMYFAEPYSLYQGEDAKSTPSVATFDKWVKKVDANVFSSTEPVSASTAGRPRSSSRRRSRPQVKTPLVRAWRRHSTTSPISRATTSSLPATPPRTSRRAAGSSRQLNNGKIQRISPSPTSGYVCSPGGNHPASGWKPQTR